MEEFVIKVFIGWTLEIVIGIVIICAILVLLLIWKEMR